MGDGALRYREQLRRALRGVRVRRAVARPPVGRARSCSWPTPRRCARSGCNPWELEPLYLRKPDAEINWASPGATARAPASVSDPPGRVTLVPPEPADLHVRDRPHAAPPPARRRCAIEHAGVPAAVVARPCSTARSATRDGTRAATSWPRSGNGVVGYAGLLFALDDGHVTNVAVDPAQHRHEHRHPPAARRWPARPASRGRQEPHARGAGRATAARRRCTSRFGFAPVGVRKRYYEDVEDAIVMWAHDIDTAGLRASASTPSRQALPGSHDVGGAGREPDGPGTVGRATPSCSASRRPATRRRRRA